jgi:hypothetical protein
MVVDKSLDVSLEIIAALLRDVQRTHGAVFSTRALRLTYHYVERRAYAEGMGFLTKTLPRLGKAFDKAISGNTILNGSTFGFKPGENELPRFLGEFFSRVLQTDGAILPHPCADSVRVLRQVLYLFYKYELPYSAELEQQVIQQFEKTEEDLSTVSAELKELRLSVDKATTSRGCPVKDLPRVNVVRKARSLLSDLFAYFDPTDIIPRHGPGVVATRQKLHEKYHWTNVSGRITSLYPLDAYFYASLGHVCDRLDGFNAVTDLDLPARVILVPKDSRGPRLISCEPVDFQWIQQGLGRAIVALVENAELTKFNVNFTDQKPNGRGALLGSSTGRYATLDLKEASDRVSTDLVHLLFPEHIVRYLLACRSSATVLPNGKELNLLKYAPMGSSLCFPILALTVWSILTAAAPDADTREGILVYGDDVIVPTAYAANAIEQLESFGLLVNRDKSCTSGLFRESCGMDAFNGTNVTPVRLRTVWSSVPTPEVYTSWIAYANSFFDRQCYHVYDLIVGKLRHTYGTIPDKDMHLACPSLRSTPDAAKPKRSRWNKRLQKREFLVWDVKSPSIIHESDGWEMLLRYQVEKGASANQQDHEDLQQRTFFDIDRETAFSVSQYTSRRTSMLVKRWR